MSIWKRFTDWYQGNNEVEKEPPRRGLARVGYLAINHTGKLILISLLFLACCIPVFTIPAALSALNRYLGKMFREGYGFSRADYWKEFREGLWKCLPLGILTFALGFYGYYLMSLAGNFKGSEAQSLLLGMGFGILVIAAVLAGYLFVLSSMVELPGRQLLKNAVILMITEWKNSLLLAGEQILFWGACLAGAPWSLWMILLGFGIQQLAVYSIVDPTVKRRIIEPYERAAH